MTIVQLIREARHQMSVRRAGGYKTWINTELDARWMGARANWETAGLPVIAYVETSSWVAKCLDCPESIIVDSGEPFYCLNCQNAKNGGMARPVLFPPDRAEIERLLLLRHDPNTRNWLPHETVDDLRAENLEHGEKV